MESDCLIQPKVELLPNASFTASYPGWLVSISGERRAIHGMAQWKADVA